MPRLVEADPLEPGAVPGGVRSAVEDVRRGGAVRRHAEHEAGASGRLPVLLEQAPKLRDHRNGSAPRPALRLDHDSRRVHRPLDADEAVCEVDVLPVEGAELPEPEACIERRCPEGAIIGPEGGEEVARLLRVGDPVPPAAHCGQPQPVARTGRDVAVLHRAAVDHAQRLEGVADRRRVRAALEHLVGEPLDVAARDAAELGPAEDRQDV